MSEMLKIVILQTVTDTMFIAAKNLKENQPKLEKWRNVTVLIILLINIA